MSTLLRSSRAAVALLMVAVALAFVLPIEPARAETDPTASALDWLNDELAANSHQLGFKGAPQFVDWGLTIDFVLALAGGGRGGAPETAATTDNILANASSYLSFDTPGELYAGPLAKLLYMAEVQGRPTTNVGGMNLEPSLRGQMQVAPDPQPGRFSDTSAYGDSSNGFGQAFAVLALAPTSGGVPPEALSFLLAQQCPAGGFRLFYDSATTCTSDDQADLDATGLAIDALVGQPGASNAISKASGWLVALQDASGAFAGSGPTATLNANSTGIIAQALRAAGQSAAADKAGAWIQALQLTGANAGAASADVGAIAYDPGQRDDAIAHGMPAERDPFRRATSQGVLALPRVVLSSGGGGGGGGAVPAGATISTSTAKPGDTVAVGGSGFTPGEPVRFTLFSDPVVLGTTNADATGLASLTFVVPTDTASGGHEIEVLGLSSGKRLAVPLQVTGATTTTTSTTTTMVGATTTAPGTSGGGTAPATTVVDSGTLPRTGNDATRGVPIAAVLIVAGVALVALTSRRLTRHMS